LIDDTARGDATGQKGGKADSSSGNHPPQSGKETRLFTWTQGKTITFRGPVRGVCEYPREGKGAQLEFPVSFGGELDAEVAA